jgi:hypothetical protein
MTEAQRAAQQVAQLLKETVPEPLKETLMVRLGTILESFENRGQGGHRCDVFNEVYKILGEERRTAA